MLFSCGGGLAAALACALLTGCERQDTPPAKPEAAPAVPAAPMPVDKPSSTAASAPCAIPTLSADDLAAITPALKTRIEKAYDEACSASDDIRKLQTVAALYFVHGFPGQAALCWEQATSRAPDQLISWYGWGLAAVEAGADAQAVAAFEHVLGARMDYTPVCVRLADLLVDADPERATTLYRRALELNQSEPRAFFGLGRIAAAQGQSDDALELLHKAIGLAPDYANARNALADLLAADGQVTEAADQRRWAAHGEPEPELPDPVAVEIRWLGIDSEVLCAQAMNLARRGDYEGAEELISQAREANAQDTYAGRALGALRAMQERYFDSVAELKTVLDVDPSLVAARSDLGQVQVEQGRLEEAEKTFRLVLAERPGHAPTLHRLAALLAPQDRSGEPIELMRAAVEKDPRNAAYHALLAQVLNAARLPDEALGHQRQAVELDPWNLTVRHELAGVLARSGDGAGARAEWQRILEINPGVEVAYLGLLGLASSRHDSFEVQRLSREGLVRLPDSHLLANSLAWSLATTRDDGLRNGEEAVQWANRACSMTQGRVHAYLDTLAAAYAAVGQFDKALDMANRALTLAQQAGDAGNVEEYTRRIELYQQGTPYLQTP